MRISIKTLCRVLGVNRGSYYAWLKRPLPKREIANQTLISKLKAIHEESDGTYGALRITKKLKLAGLCCSRHRVARLMRREGIFGCAKRKSRWVSLTNSNHHYPIAPRVFKQEQEATKPQAPNQVWVSDTTYVATQEGWLYLTIQLDTFTRKIVGYKMADRLRTELAWESLKIGLKQQSEALSLKTPQLIAHSDRGGEYGSDLYRNKLNQLGVTQSMSRSGNCYDNAYAESFFHTLKVELVHRREFKTKAEAERAISCYIDNWYNCRRLHSGLGYQTPTDYERQVLAA